MYRGKESWGEPPLGTAGFAAPERFKRQFDQRSDIFETGRAFFYLLTGHDPSTSYPNVPSFDDVGVEVDFEIKQVINKMMEHEPDNRYQSFIELRQDLDKMTQDEPVQEEVNATMRLKTLLGLWVIAILLLVVGCAGTQKHTDTSQDGSGNMEDYYDGDLEDELDFEDDSEDDSEGEDAPVNVNNRRTYRTEQLGCGDGSVFQEDTDKYTLLMDSYIDELEFTEDNQREILGLIEDEGQLMKDEGIYHKVALKVSSLYYIFRDQVDQDGENAEKWAIEARDYYTGEDNVGQHYLAMFESHDNQLEIIRGKNPEYDLKTEKGRTDLFNYMTTAYKDVFYSEDSERLVRLDAMGMYLDYLDTFRDLSAIQGEFTDEMRKDIINTLEYIRDILLRDGYYWVEGRMHERAFYKYESKAEEFGVTSVNGC